MSKWDFIKTLLKEVENQPKDKEILREVFNNARNNTRQMNGLRVQTDKSFKDYDPFIRDRVKDEDYFRELRNHLDNILGYEMDITTDSPRSSWGSHGLDELRYILKNKEYITDDAIKGSERRHLFRNDHNKLYDEILKRIGNSKDKRQNAQIGREYLQEIFTK